MTLEGLEQLSTPTPVKQFIPKATKKWKALLIGYLYFIQGIMLSLPNTIILTYSKLPSYDVLSWVAASTIPFGLKFISAPVVEKYTSLGYGRRKTWIVITCILTSLFTFILSYYTDQQHMMTMAVSFIFVIFLISIQDISTDALAIKQLDSAQLMSYLQTLMQQVGLIFGSMVFIKMTSKQFAQSLGYQDSFMTSSSYFKLISIIVLIPTILIHFKFKQTLLEEQKQIKEQSLIKVLLNYKHFFNLKSRYFRQGITFLFYYQGINFYSHGYTFELMKNGFSKEAMNTIDNLILFPLLFVTGLFSSINTNSKRLFYMRLMLIIRLAWQVFGLCIPQHTNTTLTLYSFISNGLAWMIYIVDANTVNGFPPSALSGMFVTALYSCRNLGSNSPSLHLKIISWIGFTPAVLIGFAYTLIILLLLPRIVKWIDQGSVDIHQHTLENEKNQIKQD